MAQKIVVGLGTYLIDFTNGQAAFRAPPYTQYTTDHDTNYITLQSVINQLIDEVNAVQGPNAGLGIDILTFDRPGRAGGTLLSGLVGIDSFATTISTGDVVVGRGVVIVDGTKVSNGVGGTFDAAAIPDGTAFVAIDLNGALSLNDDPGQADLDLYQVTVTGGVASSPVRLADVFFDGDEYERLRDRPLTGGFAAKDHDQAYLRLAALERVLSGLTTDDDGDALPVIRIPNGSAASPAFVLANSLTTGLFRQAANVLGVSIAGSEVLRVVAAGLQLAVAGSAGAPAIARTTDPNTGAFFPGPDRFAWATAGNQCGEFDAAGQLDLPRNGRFKAQRTAAQSIADSAAFTEIAFTAADLFDVGDWHDPGGTATDAVCPTDFDGTYALVASVNWASPVTNPRTIVVEITKDTGGGPTRIPGAFIERDVAVGEEFAVVIPALDDVAAGDILSVRVSQVDAVGALALDVQDATLAAHKVA